MEKLKAVWAWILANKKSILAGIGILLVVVLYLTGYIKGCNAGKEIGTESAVEETK